jgi:hypothetical protein
MPKKILVVDDELNILKLIATRLKANKESLRGKTRPYNFRYQDAGGRRYGCF